MRVLAIVHEPGERPGVFAPVIRDRGDELDEWPVLEHGLPGAAAHEYDAVMSFGGSMHVDQENEHPWLAGETALHAELVARGTPLLAVCLGAQLLAKAAGGGVQAAPRPEIGWYRVSVSPDGMNDPLLGPLAPGFQALEWHSYEFTAPPEPAAVALASSERCLQALRVGPHAWGIQFHAEVTLTDLETWIDDHEGDDLQVAAAQELRACTREQIGRWNALGRELCARFLDQACNR
jgi:GMP synthase (glutamine-hydrolysing)